MRASALANFADTFDEEIPSSELAWPEATPEQLAFMRRVYEAHVTRSAAVRSFIGDLPSGELAEVEDGKMMRSEAAADCRSMLAAARAELAAQKTSGSGQARYVRWIGITSGYRSAREQFAIWQKNFRRIYAESEKERAEAAGGAHGDAAVTLLVAIIGEVVAAPGYSLHNDGRAADLKTSERALTLGASRSQRTPWRQTWFWDWLVDNAARFRFFQNTHINEPWHWEHRPPRRSAGSEWSEATSIPGGEKVIDVVPLLASHKGSHPDLFFRWNDMTIDDEIDVAVHFHGFSSHGRKMNIVTDRVPVSGLEWVDPQNSFTRRTRPTLFVLPRGNHAGGAKYTFPALTSSDSALTDLVTFALDEFGTAAGLATRPRVKRLILAAHSGGGAALEQVLAYVSNEPAEVHLFDGTYGSVKNIRDWTLRRIAAEGNSGAEPGALRVLYLPNTKTEANALILKRAITAAIHGLPNEADLAKRYRVEKSKEGHGTIPKRYGWQLFVDNAADLL